ncbi:hypothetical protein [Pantanalinema sp. GBBB05]|uniref:hypothetical protein n=1 Tax=Pantanalinema sp. GBBB05 TaxID=2604139 RepID=UPI001DA95383|nr:low temperature-induced protein [Pantanalinema sp. GBBB05]
MSRVFRFLAATVLCAVMFFANVVPAFALPANTASKSAPDKGEAQLEQILDDSENALQNGVPGLKATQGKAQEGINEVQGAADRDKMKRPENAEATSVIDRVENALEKVVDR